MTKQTQIVRISKETWKNLNSLKCPGDTFDQVIVRLVDEYKESNNQKS